MTTTQLPTTTLTNSRCNDYRSHDKLMPSQLAADIKQKKRFASLEQEAFLLLQRTTSELAEIVDQVLKNAGLSGPQYNVLRILRGAGAHGLACGEISERLITRDPDITRLLDRMEKRSLVARRRDVADRRVIIARITRAGLDLLARLDGPITATHRKQLGHLTKRQLKTLIDILDAARQRKTTTSGRKKT
jgi:DNA-binding MarR family transcriptional regulator